MIDKETEDLKKEKKNKKLALTDLRLITALWNLFSNFADRDTTIKLMICNFIHFVKPLKIDLNDIKKYSIGE